MVLRPVCTGTVRPCARLLPACGGISGGGGQWAAHGAPAAGCGKGYGLCLADGAILPPGGAVPMPCAWGHGLAGSTAPDATQLARCLPELAFFVAPALRPHGVDVPALQAWACAAWPVLQPAEWLVVSGGDERLDPGAQTGLNRYGCQPLPRYGELDFSSSTASTQHYPRRGPCIRRLPG